MLKATNTNNNPKVVTRYYMDYIRGMQSLSRVVRADAGTENIITRELQFFFRGCHTDEMHEEKKVSHWNVRFEPKDRNVMDFFHENFFAFW